jgi:hypothetical protein
MKRWLLGGAVLVLLVVGAVVSLLLLDVDRFRGQILAEVQARTGRSATLGGPIELAISLHPTLMLTDLVIGAAPGRDGPALLTVRRVEVQAALLPLLSGELRVQRLFVDGADLQLTRGADGAASAAAGTDSVAAPAPSLAEARVNNSRVRVRDAAGVGIEVIVDRLTLGRGEGNDLLSFSFEGRGDGVALQASGSTGRIAALLRPDAPFPLDARIEALGFGVQVAGTIARPLRGEGIALQVQARAASLAALSSHLALDLPPDLPLALDAAVSGDAATLALRDLVASLGDNRVQGQLDLALAGERPRLAGTLHAQRLDLLQLAGTAFERAGADTPERVFSDAPLDFAGLRAMDADIEFSGARVNTPFGELNTLQSHLKLDNGMLRIAPLRAQRDEGTLEGSVALSAAHPDRTELELEFEARKLEVARVLERMGQEPFVQGLADLSVDLRGRGASSAAIAASLDGRVKLLMGEARGRLSGLDRIVGGLTKVIGDLAGGGTGEWTPINCLAADFAIAQGIATRKVLLLDTDSVTVAGAGTIDLRRERLDLTFTPQPKSMTLNVSLPVHVGGTLMAPTVSADQSAAVRRAGSLLGGLLFPPAALAAFFDMGSGEDHPCAALAAAGTQQPAAARPVQKKPGGLLDDVTDGIKSLFGN